MDVDAKQRKSCRIVSHRQVAHTNSGSDPGGKTNSRLVVEAAASKSNFTKLTNIRQLFLPQVIRDQITAFNLALSPPLNTKTVKSPTDIGKELFSFWWCVSDSFQTRTFSVTSLSSVPSRSGFLEVISRASLKMAVDKWTWKEKTPWLRDVELIN